MHTSFAAAFAGSRFADEEGRIIEVTVHVIGDLKVPTGRLFASDPLTTSFDASHGEALDRAVPPGVYPVDVAVARFESGDQRVACARVRFAPPSREAVTWIAASPNGQPELEGDDTWGYGVDTGTGCFFDGAAVGDVDEATSDRWVEALNAKDVPTWTWHIADVGGANVVMFSSGWGDGVYTSYWGLDVDGAVVELVTDFDVLVKSERDEILVDLPLPRGAYAHPLLAKHGVTMRVPLLSWRTVVLGGNSASSVALTDGTPVTMEWRGAERHYSWSKPSPGARLSISVTTGATSLDVVTD